MENGGILNVNSENQLLPQDDFESFLVSRNLLSIQIETYHIFCSLELLWIFLISRNQEESFALDSQPFSQGYSKNSMSFRFPFDQDLWNLTFLHLDCILVILSYDWSTFILTWMWSFWWSIFWLTLNDSWLLVPLSYDLIVFLWRFVDFFVPLLSRTLFLIAC